MTKEKLQLVIPVVFTVGPHDPALTRGQSLSVPEGGIHQAEAGEPGSSLMKVGPPSRSEGYHAGEIYEGVEIGT